MKFSGAVAILFLSAVTAMAYPRPIKGTEDIPKLMAEATLVCKGEVTSAPKPVPVFDAPRLTGTATVRVDRCFKGDPGGTVIRVAVDNFLPPAGGPVFVLDLGDYRLFFLKPLDGRYTVVDPWSGVLATSRKVAHVPDGSDTMLSLELDLKAGLHDRDPERVLDSIRMLGNMRTLRSNAELKTLLTTHDLLVKTYVWQALLRLKDYSVLPAVVRFFAIQREAPRRMILGRDRLLFMQGELIREVGNIRSLDAVPYLEKFALSKNRLLRDEALQALRQIGSLHSIPVFLSELDDPDPDNAFSAMQGLLSLRAADSVIHWVPTGEVFRQSPKFYAAKTREWWWKESKKAPGFPQSMHVN